MQKIVDMINSVSQKERSMYHLTFGKLIDALKKAKDTDRITPTITGIGSYRGYYSDLALMTKTIGTEPMYSKKFDYMTVTSEEMDKLEFSIKRLSENPHELVKQLESMIGKYTDGYKGGLNIVDIDTPLWIAEHYGDCSDNAVIGITDDLKLITEKI